MPARDGIYMDMDYEIKQRLEARQRQAPRAFALHAELTALFKTLDILDKRGAMLLLAIEVLNLVLARADDDITVHEERDVRRACDLPPTPMVTCPKCEKQIPRPACTPFVCRECRQLVHIPGAAK